MLAKVISSIPSRKLVGQGCLAYLAHIEDVEFESLSIVVFMSWWDSDKYFLPIFMVFL